MNTRRRKIGLYVFQQPEALPLDKLPQSGKNAQTALTHWFGQVESACRQLMRKRRGSSHAKLASLILKEIDFVRSLVERIDGQSDRHFVLLTAMRFMRSVRDLQHNLALFRSVDSRRRATAKLAKARRSKKCPYTPEQYDAAAARAGGKLYLLARELGHDVKTVKKYGRPSA